MTIKYKTLAAAVLVIVVGTVFARSRMGPRMTSDEAIARIHVKSATIHHKNVFLSCRSFRAPVTYDGGGPIYIGSLQKDLLRIDVYESGATQIQIQLFGDGTIDSDLFGPNHRDRISDTLPELRKLNSDTVISGRLEILTPD